MAMVGISVDELYEYVHGQVRELTPNQTPNMIAHVQGPLYIARARLPNQTTAARTGPPQGTAAGFDGVAKHFVEVAQVHLRDGRNKAALEVISKACERAPGHVEALAIRGWVQYRLGRHSEALADLNAALETDPGNLTALTARGATLHALEKHSQALADLNVALEADPGNLTALTARGAAHQALGYYPEALADLTLVLQRNPTHVRSLFRRAYLYLLLDQPKQRITDLKRVLQLEPANLDALERLGDIEYIDRAIDLNPRDPELFVLRAMVHNQKSNSVSALRDLSMAIELDPTWAYPMVERGLLRRQQARLRRAREDLTRALELGLDNPDTAFMVARTLKRTTFKMYGSIACGGILLFIFGYIVSVIRSKLHGFWFWPAIIGFICTFPRLFWIPFEIREDQKATPPLERHRWINKPIRSNSRSGPSLR